MSLQHGHDEKGEWLKITYYDEDGADVSERFRLQTPAQRTAFEQLYPPAYAHTGHPAALDHRRRYPRPASLIATPDFVVARMKGQYRVRESVRLRRSFRRAHELRG